MALDVNYVCISLKEKTERREKAKKAFKRLGIEDSMNWWIVDKHPVNGEYGCFESHWSTWIHYYNCWVGDPTSPPFLCIFEDDVEPTEHAEEFRHVLPLIREALVNPERNIDIIHLAFDPAFYPTSWSNSLPIVKGKYYGFVGYIIYLPRFIPRVQECNLRSYYGIGIDFVTTLFLENAAINPQLVFQRYRDSSISDTRSGWKERFIHRPICFVRQKCIRAGGVYWYEKWAEWEKKKLIDVMKEPKNVELIDRRVNRYC